MGFGVEWWDLRAEDVHEVIEWADAKADTEQIYTLFVRFIDPYPPGREWIVRIAGADPTTNPDFDDGFHRHPPLAATSVGQLTGEHRLDPFHARQLMPQQ
jgi:hypothetical protein